MQGRVEKVTVMICDGMCRVILLQAHVCSAVPHDGGHPLRGVQRSSQAQKEQAEETGGRVRDWESARAWIWECSRS